MSASDTPLSAIVEAGAQPELFPGLEAGESSTLGTFSGERLARQRPEVYRGVCQALAEGISARAIARAYRVSPGTVAAIREREAVSIGALKTGLAADARRGATLAIERIIEEIDQIKREQLPVVAGILIDKMQILEGAPTSITAQAQARGASFGDALDALRAQAGGIEDAEIVAEVPAMGSGGEGENQTGASRAGGGGEVAPGGGLECGGEVATPGDGNGGTDSQSVTDSSIYKGAGDCGHAGGHVLGHSGDCLEAGNGSFSDGGEVSGGGGAAAEKSEGGGGG